MDKYKKVLFGLILIINILLMILRFKTVDVESIHSNILSLVIFLIIISLLLYFFFSKKYDAFILIWLSFYFASPLIVLPFISIGSLGILNGLFIPLIIYTTFDFKNLHFKKYYIIILGLLVISIINIASSDIRIILSRIFLFISPFVFFFFVLKKCKDLELLLWSSIIIALLNFPLGIYEILFKPGWGIEMDWRGFRIFGNLFWHNSYSFYLLPSILVLYALYKKSSKTLLLLLMLILLVLDFFTFSRTGLITLGLSICIFELLYSKGFKITLMRILIFLILIFGILLYVNGYLDLSSRFKPEAISERTMIWQTIIPFIQDNLIFGNGIGSYEIYRVNFLNELSSHNFYLNIIFELGLVGLGLSLAFIFFIFKDLKNKLKSKNRFRSGEMGLALLVGILFFSFFGNAAFTQVVSLNAWIVLACCVKYDEKD
jgi:O-antigen ligase